MPETLDLRTLRVVPGQRHVIKVRPSVFVDINALSENDYDCVIVGSGMAGLAVATSFAQAGKRSLVLESGGQDYDPALHQSLGAMQGFGHLDGAYWTRHWYRTLGGTSYVWGGWCARFQPRDLEGWPIGPGDLEAGYREAGDFLRRPTSTVGAMYDPEILPGFRYSPFSTSPALRIQKDLRDALARDPNIHVLLNTSLRALVPDKNRSRVNAMELVSLPDQAQTLTLGERQPVILAAGGMGNAQLLLQPPGGDGTGGSEVGLGNERDQVGRYLMEHPHVFDGGHMIVRNGAKLTAEVPETFGPLWHALRPDDRLYRSLGRTDVSLIMARVEDQAPSALDQLMSQHLGGETERWRIIVQSEMKPRPECRVTLGFGKDPAGLTRVHAHCSYAASDLDAITRCMTALGQQLIARDMGRLHINNATIYRDVTGGGHTMGTTRMGADPSDSVVDSNCRVHGYANLYCAGSSVFRSGAGVNPTLTLVALAKRLATHLGSSGS